MAEISVIVPIYNVEEYLAWCLDSLRGQTFHDIEVVCVIDGATDGSRAIAARYAEADPRFVIVDKPNGGPSSARNVGIRAASAPYVCFVDSDDRFTPDACEKIVAAFERTDADVITFGANCYPESAGYDWLIQHLSPRDIEYDGFSPSLAFEEMSCPFSWRTACKRSFLIENGLFYEEGLHLGEDQVFQFAIYPRARKTLLMSDKLYDYRVTREGSQMDRLTHESASMMAEHIRIVQCVYDDWAAGGFLKQYPAEMLAWTVYFVLYGISMEPNPPRDGLLDALREVLLAHFSEEEILAAKLPRTTKNMLKAALQKPERFEGMRGKMLRYSYDLQQSGIRSAASRLLARLRKRER